MVRRYEVLKEITVLTHRLAESNQHMGDSVLVGPGLFYELSSTNRFGGIEHSGDDEEPALQVSLRILKGSPHSNAKRGIACVAVEAVLFDEFGDALRCAVGAPRSAIPAHLLKVLQTILLGREAFVDVRQVH